MKAVISIMTYGDTSANDTLLRHLPMWERLGHDLFVCSPKDNPARLPSNVQQCNIGKQGHDGPHALERQKNVMQELARRLGYDWYIVSEYDVVFLGDHLPEFTLGLSGIRNPNIHGKRFRSPWVLGPPWVMDYESLMQILAYADTHPEITEEGCMDRFLPAWAIGAGVPVHQIPQAGLFMNEITPEYYDRMIQACKSGGRFHHGIKTEECLNVLLKAYEH